jgi:hypothetical protein
MRDTHAALGRSEESPSRAAGPKGISPEFVVWDLPVRESLEIGQHVNGRERRSPAGCSLEGAVPDESVTPEFPLEPAGNEGSSDVEGCAKKTGLLVLLAGDHRDGKGMTFRPAGVHVQEHLGPGAGIDSTGAGLDAQVGMAAAVRPRQGRAGFALQENLFTVFDRSFQIQKKRRVVLGEIQDRTKLVRIIAELFLGREQGGKGMRGKVKDSPTPHTGGCRNVRLACADPRSSQRTPLQRKGRRGLF